MPNTMPTLNLRHRFADMRFVRMDVALGRVQVGMPGEDV